MKKFTFLFGFLLILSSSFGQNLKRSPVGDKVQLLKEQGQSFEGITLLEETTISTKRLGDLEKEVSNSLLLKPLTKNSNYTFQCGPLFSIYPTDGKQVFLGLYVVPG